CTFCTIPLARGASRSGKIADIVRQAEENAASGIKEIVLTGVNIGGFGLQNVQRRESILDLVRAGEEVEGIKRCRISSSDPKRFVPQFHMPLQSGSNKILAKMRRRYRRELYAERVATIKSLMPDCCIGVDVIVGFPGESREDFLETYQFLNDLPISYLHVFTYSERENTIAAQMEGSVPGSSRSERSKMLHILSEKKRRQFYEQQLGKQVEILFESDQKNGLMHGFSSNYVKVETPYDPLLINEIVAAKFTSISTDNHVTIEQIEETFAH